MKKIDSIVIQGTVDDMNKSFEEFLTATIPNKTELEDFKKQTDALFMLHQSFQQGRKLGLKFAIKSIEKYSLYDEKTE